MPDVFITMKEAAEFEGVKYGTFAQRIARNPKQYKTRTQPQENGGKEQVLVSVDSLTAKGRKAWRAAQKIDGRDVVIEKRTESAPWYVGVDLNHYTEQHKKAFYEAVELAARVQDFIDYDGPAYLRLGRMAVEYVTDSVPGYKFELGKGVKLRDGKDIAIVATGLMVYEAIEAAKTLAAEGIEATVINIHTIKPIDEDIIVEAAKNTGLLLTVEEHSVIGGLGSAVADVLAARHPAKLVKIGVNDEFGHSGPAVDLLKEYGLCADNIVAKARDAVKAK